MRTLAAILLITAVSCHTYSAKWYLYEDHQTTVFRTNYDVASAYREAVIECEDQGMDCSLVATREATVYKKGQVWKVEVDTIFKKQITSKHDEK